MDGVTMNSNVKDVIDTIDTHSAIPTWSGFEYQGQVSIYWVMKKLNQMDLNCVQLQLCDYELQLESLEDFSINFEGYPQTIHQVKAYQDNASLGSYKRAIHDLLGKSAKYPMISQCFLHTLQPIKLPENNILKNDIKEFTSEKNKQQLFEYKNLLFNEGKYDEVIQKLVLNKENEYGFKCVIGRMDIEREIKDQIRIFLHNNKAICKYEFVESDENINLAYFNLIHEISQVVAEAHTQKNKHVIIPFLKFVDILTNEFVFAFTEKTAASMLKTILSNYFIEYCEKNELKPEECSAWMKNWEWICKLSDHDFLLLCKKITPTVNVDTKRLDVIKSRELVVKVGAHKTLFPLVMETSNFALEIEGVKELFVLSKEGIFHLITTIAETWGKNEVANQGKKIFESLKNDNQLAYILFDINKIITTELEGPFEGKIVDTGLDYEAVISDFENKETITKHKKMEFMKVDNAIEVFKS